MFQLDDLEKICGKCKGSGFIQDWQWIQWWQENDAPPPEGHPLLKVQEEIPCEDCNEIGFIPTPMGTALLEFISHFRGRK